MCNSRPKTSLPVDKPAWHKATDADLFKYIECVAFNLDRIQLPDEALLCEDKHCQSHIDHFSKFHDHIIFALLEAGDKALPIARPVVSKVMPGWNNYCDGRQPSYLYGIRPTEPQGHVSRPGRAVLLNARH